MRHNTNHYHITIIGAGVVGSAIAHELSRYEGLRIALIEKEHDVAEGVSKANSGVLHAGMMVPHGTLKAKLNVRGLELMPALASSLGVEIQRCGKLVVAKDDTELPYLKRLLDTGKSNGVTGLELITGVQARGLEANVSAAHALYSPKTAVILPYLLTIAMAENALLNGVDVYLNTELTGVDRIEDRSGFCLELKNANNQATEDTQTSKAQVRQITTKMVVNAAGLGADAVARMIDPDYPHRIYGWRGEYRLLEESSTKQLKMAVYPVPPKDGSGLGVHITPTVNGGILLGPSADYIDNRHDTGNTLPVLGQLEQEALALVPALNGVPTIKTYSGVRPKLSGPGQSVTFRDFVIEQADDAPGFINLVGIESPGLTAAPAIAEYVRDHFVAEHFDLKERRDWSVKRAPIPRTRYLSSDQLHALWQSDAGYGRTVCYCESVSAAEIQHALDNPLKCRSIHAIRKRTHATLGVCQGGYCLGKIQAYMGGKVHKTNQAGWYFAGAADR